MIKEDYVSLEVAELLKEKGMDKSCFKHYVQKNNNDGTSEAITVCTLQIATKWLREMHGFIITIDYDRYPIFNGENDTVGYGYNIQTKDNPEDYYRISESVYNSYEAASEAAIKYSLENLI